MEAVQKHRISQGRRKNKKTKNKPDDPEEENLIEDRSENLSEEISNVNVSIDNESCSRSACEAKIENDLNEASADETVGLLDDESKDHLEVSEIKWLDSGQLRKEIIESQVKSYLQRPNKLSDSALSTSDTELDEIKSLPSHSIISDFQVDTKFESPQRVSKSFSIEHVEEPAGRSEPETIGSMDDIMFEIASEVSPSAPILDSVFSQNLEFKTEDEVEEAKTIEENYFTPLSFLIKEEEESTIKPYTLTQLTSLYHNSELDANGEFIEYFVESELRGGEVTRHPLYEILVGYLRARGRLTANAMELETLKGDCIEYQAKLWTLQKRCITRNGECQDGNPVEASHEFQVAHFDKPAATKLSRSLSAIKDLVNESHALNAYTCEVLKLQVEHYIQNISAEFSFLPHNAPVNLVPEGLPAFSNQTGRDLRVVISDLRIAISVLFTFQRRPIKDIGFIADTRQWLSKLVGIILRVATWRDHMFILNHVLRCPSGVSHWATSFIQPPPCPHNSSFSNEHLDHLVTTLATILLPIKQRDHFLSNYGGTVLTADCKVPVGLECTVTLTSETDNVWVMVDSEGEDEIEEGDEFNFKENDIVALLNQIPFDAIYRQVLQITHRDEQDFYDTSIISDHQVLRLMAFCSLLIDLLEKGLSNHSSVRYKQFAKRLGRLVRHTTQYATDHWQVFRNDKIGTDAAMIERLQVEYDALVMRAAKCLYNTPGHSTWQFLAVLPFSSITLRTLWKLFCLLLQGDEEPIDEKRWQERLEEKLSELSDADTYYLLTTIATMAMARTQEDFLFIKAATLQLLEIGFLNVATRELCSKSARIMLANLSTKHPSLISVLLEKLYMSSQVGKLILYLVKELPLGVWKPLDSDLTILEDWLACPIISIRNNVARYLITHLNWGFVSAEGHETELFLSHSVHVRVAMMIVKVANIFCPSSPVSSGSITDSVKQMSILASSMVRPNSSEQALIVWLWQTAYKLHLHLIDQSDADIKISLSNPLTAFTAIPDLESESEELEVLNDGVQKQQVMAIYVCLQLTSMGHNVPLICTKGFTLISVLQSYHLHTAVIALLQNMIPLFLDCPESLTSNEKFPTILTTLLGADRTYLKVAKSLIAPDFPGHILTQFGCMVQYHLLNYTRYCLTSPAPIVDIWMKCLCSVWKDEPTSAAYIMDIIISTAFFKPDVKSIAFDAIALLLQNVSLTSQTNSRLSSLFSWISIGGTGTVVSLVPQGSSCPYTPWFAYFALQVEEIHIQGTNGLWKEVLKELASVSGKASVDNAVKRASSSLNIAQPPSSALSIYRWSQQALDTPADHPVLPLLWQRFFMLYFAQVPSISGVSDQGSVGTKFFEGMTNITYTKKLKRKLFDCSEYYNTKSESTGQQLSQNRLTLYGNLAKLYRTLSLWLEEPKLHEPGLYFPALPPQYSPLRLASIVNGDKGPWYEFIDYESINNSYQDRIQSWMQTLGRSQDMTTPTVPQFQEDNDPVQRIIKRLETYDSPLPPPTLRPSQPIVPNVTRDVLLYKGITLDSLKDSFKALLDFAQIYYLRTSEHTALDCTFLELVPTLFVNSENKIKLLAACDTIDPEAKPNQRPPPASALNCAGPAVIYITICSARENEGVGHQIQINRVEMEGVLKRSLQPPPMAICVASIYIEHLTQALERECMELKRIGDIQMLTSVQDVGIALFYHISSMFNDEAMSYPPIKQLFTSCIEILGQSFISGEANQCVRLLSEVLQNPRISGLLGPHFTPSSADATTFLNIYSTVVDMEATAPTDLLFVLLTKFDVSQWLSMRRPRLVERSQLIELIGKALAMAGQTPSEDKLMLHEVFRRHLSTLFVFDFPEHYGEVLNLALRHSETQTLAIDVWFDIINSLAGAKFRPGMSLGQIKEEIHRYATEQKALSLQELRDTASLFGNHFTKERLQYGLYGLYPKYRTYIEPLTTLLGMIGHALIVATLQNDRGTLSDKLCEQLWPSLSGLFSPWLAPYFTRHLAEPTAAWIQQLTEDRSVLPPWIVADGGHAHKMAAMFTETIRFILDTLPACSNILGFLWQFYVTSYAHSSIKDHILNVMHGNLLTLPWQRFFPTLQDLDLMLEVVDQYLPDCHTFLGAVFIEVSWNNWVTNIGASYPISVAAKTHGALLHLLIKLANEPNVRQSPKITPLLLESQQFSWHLIDCNNYTSVANWFVMSYDPRVILQLTKEDWSGIDTAALDLLQIAGGFTSTATHYHPSTPRKRQVYVRATVKLLLSCLSKYKPLATSRQEEVKSTIRKMVDKVEVVVDATAPGPQKASEAGLLMVEILKLVNQPTNSPVSDLALDAILSWLSTRNSSSVVVAALLRSLGTTVANQEILGTLLEAALTAFFRRGVGESASGLNWSVVVSVLQPIVPRHPPLEESLVTCGQLLSLYALVLKHLPSMCDIREEANILHNMTEWIVNVKVNESMESKLPLLWSKVLSLCHRQCEFSSDNTTGVRYLQKLVQAVTQNAEHRAGAGWGLLGAIGICRTQTITNKCRFLSRVLAALVLAQLPVRREETTEQNCQFVRTKPHSPGSVISTNGEYCPSGEALKALSTLEGLTADKNYAELKTVSDFALKLIRQPENSLHNADHIFINITLQIYNDNFIHALKPTPIV